MPWGLRPIEPADAFREFGLDDRLWALRVTSDSILDGRKLQDTHLGDAAGLLVLAVGRGEEIHVLPGPTFILCRGDHLMVKARPDDLAMLRGLQRLGVDLEADFDAAQLEGEDAGFTEALIAPQSSLIGKTLRQVRFRDRFGLHAVAIVRDGGVVRTNLRENALRFGDVDHRARDRQVRGELAARLRLRLRRRRLRWRDLEAALRAVLVGDALRRFQELDEGQVPLTRSRCHLRGALLRARAPQPLREEVNRVLELRDLRVEAAGACALGEQQRLQRLDIIGQFARARLAHARV